MSKIVIKIVKNYKTENQLKRENVQRSCCIYNMVVSSNRFRWEGVHINIKL